MGSTGETDRKRRQLSSISPTSAPAKKQSSLPVSEDKKLDAAVLQYQNQKLSQKLEAQKIEISALEKKFFHQMEKQQPYDRTLMSVNKYWGKLVDDLESCSVNTRSLARSGDTRQSLAVDAAIDHVSDGVSASCTNAFLKRLEETGATESCSASSSPNQMVEVGDALSEKSKNILQTIVAAVHGIWSLKDHLYASILKTLPEYGSCRLKASNDLQAEVKNLRSAVSNLHLEHKSLTKVMWHHQNIDVNNKAELKRLKGEFGSHFRELDDNNRRVNALKVEKDATKGTFFPVLNLATKPAGGDRGADKQRDWQDMESSLKELTDQSSSRLQQLLYLHEERIRVLLRLSNMQSTLKNLKCISSSQAFQLVIEQLEKSKAELILSQALFQHLQTEKDKLAWRDRQSSISSDLCDVYRRSCTVADSRINDLRAEMQKQTDARKQVEFKLEGTLKEPGRKEVLSKFKALASSFPEDMSKMQSELRKYKDSAADIHSLHADVQSLTNVLGRKAKELEVLSTRSANQETEIQGLHFLVQDLKECDMELNLFLEMYRCESILTREVAGARDLEYEARSLVQSLKFSLDENSLELRVKESIEAEAMSQQRLAGAEAEIADLRQKCETAKRDVSRLSEALNSKNEENKAYLSEIETIGQAYDDMQNQNQLLLEQITERDDYNIKLVVEAAKARQMHDCLHMKKQTLERRIRQANVSCEFFENKAARIEEEVRTCSNIAQKIDEERRHNSVILDNTHGRTSDANRSCQQSRESVEGLQSKIKGSQLRLAGLQISLDKERYDKKRLEEHLEAAKRKALRLTEEIEGSSPVAKLREELQEYCEILKCGVCSDRAKEVVITKCYHLFCSPCVQRVLETRHRKCPICSASFGPNDVKPVYI